MFSLLILLLAATLLDSPAGHAAPSGAPPAVEDPACARRIEQAESLLKKDLYEDALDLAGSTVDRCPANARAHVAQADALYRRGDFEEAERHYRRAVELDSGLAAAHFGVGRILRTLGRYGDAAASFARALALDPDRPKYLRIMANHLARHRDSLAMLRRYVELVKRNPGSDEEAALGNVEAWIALLEKVGDEPLQQMVKKEPTSVPLQVRSKVASIKINVAGVKNRRFVFDTGATGVTISPRLARRAKLEPIRPFTIAGTGSRRTETGDLVLIDELTVGDRIVLHNVPATVRDPLGPEAGLIGPSLFGQLAMTIDLKGRRLTFDRPGASRPGTVLPFRNVGGEIVIRTAVNDVAFNTLVDTGATSTIIGRTTVGRLPDMDALPGRWFGGVSMGVGGPLADRKVILTGTLTVAGRSYPADGMLSGNLDGISRSLESEIYVILGVPELDDFILTIDYRAMTVTFAARASNKTGKRR
ncbi:MAG: aspartyl protease family protein [Acidobacteriota bacterium]